MMRDDILELVFTTIESLGIQAKENGDPGLIEYVYREAVEQAANGIFMVAYTDQEDISVFDILMNIQELMEGMANVFDREFAVVEQDITDAIDAIPVEEFEESQDIGERNRLN